jgi:RNA polymerase sigma factor (sigma-70 family)
LALQAYRGHYRGKRLVAPPERVLMNAVLRHLHRTALLQDGGGLTDWRLLERFLAQRDEDAFAALVRRHGSMVLAVCRRVLENQHDAEDAFQATFLVFARKAASFPRHQLVAGWLHETAYRTSMKARTMMARRRARERRMQQAASAEVSNPECDEDMLRILDQELSKLPEKYRMPLVLCALEGRSRKDAGHQLRITESQLSSRLAYAKKLLAQRLARRTGIGPAGAMTVLAGGAASSCVPRALVHATAKAAGQFVSGHSLVAGVVSAQVLTLTEGVMKAMLLSKLKTAGAMVLAVVVGLGALGSSYQPATAQSQGPRDGSAPARATRDELEELRLEVAALRKGLQVTRDQLKVLQGEVRTLMPENHAEQYDAKTAKTRVDHSERLFNVLDLPVAEHVPLPPNSAKMPPSVSLPVAEHVPSPPNSSTMPPPVSDIAFPTTEQARPILISIYYAELALKNLRADSKNKEADALERALQSLRKSANQKTGPEKPDK